MLAKNILVSKLFLFMFFSVFNYLFDKMYYIFDNYISLFRLNQDERELKRQRRKQSNRESARRSRLRKQVTNPSVLFSDSLLSRFFFRLSMILALCFIMSIWGVQAECDELSQRAEALKEENATLRAELSRIRSDYEQILAQNASLKVPTYFHFILSFIRFFEEVTP